MSELRKEKLLVITLILESFGGFRRVDNNTIKLLTVEVGFDLPSNVMI